MAIDHDTNPHMKAAARRRLRTGLLLLVVFAGLGSVLYAQLHDPNVVEPGTPRALSLQQDGPWSVGELRENGLRIIPSGRSDASAVLNPEQFSDAEARHAYWIATQIPETLNQLYCWCGCENRGVHRSNLQCFEDEMGQSCDVCRGTAEIAYEMVTKEGVTEAARIQAGVDAVWAPEGS